jgi:hypothetical protein
MMLERNRVDYVNGPTRRGRCAKEHTVDCLVRVFEGMEYDFGVGEVGELKAWARHAAELSRLRGSPNDGIRPARDNNRDTLLGEFLRFAGHFSFKFLSRCFLVAGAPRSQLTLPFVSFLRLVAIHPDPRNGYSELY